MKTKLVNKDIRENYTNELLMERGLSPEELEYFLNVPDNSALQDPINLDYIEQAGAMFEYMTTCTNQETIAVIVDRIYFSCYLHTISTEMEYSS